MTETAAQELVRKTMEAPFSEERFGTLTANMLNYAAFSRREIDYQKSYEGYVSTFEQIATYTDDNDKRIDVLTVRLQGSSLGRARTKQRNIVAGHLRKGGKNAALVAFAASDPKHWRFSFVQVDYRFSEGGKPEEELTPARRSSFLVGEEEKSHTAQRRLLPLLREGGRPKLEDVEGAFSVEKVTDAFFEEYKELFFQLTDEMDRILEKNPRVQNYFQDKNIDTVSFSKKLLGQVVFLYFLQKKGWFGVKRGAKWGSGDKDFLRTLFEKSKDEQKSFFNDVLERMFYEALSTDRRGDEDYYKDFSSRIPFLNGGLFEPFGNYDWKDLCIPLPDELFSNTARTKEGDRGTGILDVFDRYNFTVKEDEPLEREVAVDPEMLGKVFENLLEIKDRKSQGAYYTPRKVVHYMCQESLIDYLATELKGHLTGEEIGEWVRRDAEAVEERDTHTHTHTHTHTQPLDCIRRAASSINTKLEEVRVCDPAVGSGAFVVEMMNEIVRLRIRAKRLEGEHPSEQMVYEFKCQIVENCLYGVDIEPGATEIARLRMWLSLVVDEQKQETVDPLPNLDYKIIEVDALRGAANQTGLEAGNKELSEKQKLLFDETGSQKKQDLPYRD